jgi:hypothetical protein
VNRIADATIAESLIVRELESRGFLEGVIGQFNGDTVEVLWPRNFKGAFSLN